MSTSDLLKELGYGSEQDIKKPKSEKNDGFGGDTVSQLKSGFQQLPSVITGLLDIPADLTGLGSGGFEQLASLGSEITGFKPKQWSEETKAREYSLPLRQALQKENQVWDNKDSTAGDIAGLYLTNPRLASAKVMESLPSMLAGGVAAKGLQAAKGLSAITSAGIGEGAVMAGQAMNDIQTDDYQNKALASLGIGVIGGAIGAGSGAIANKAGVFDANQLFLSRGLSSGASKGTLSNIASMSAKSAGLEAAEEIAQTYAEVGIRNTTEGKDFNQGMNRALVEAGLAGGLMGFAGGSISGALSRTASKVEPQTELEDTQNKDVQTTGLKTDTSQTIGNTNLSVEMSATESDNFQKILKAEDQLFRKTVKKLKRMAAGTMFEESVKNADIQTLDAALNLFDDINDQLNPNTKTLEKDEQEINTLRDGEQHKQNQIDLEQSLRDKQEQEIVDKAAEPFREKHRNYNKVKPEMSAIEAITQLGGINSDLAIGEGIDPAATKQQAGFKKLFNRGKNSMSFEDTAAVLDSLGYNMRDESGALSHNKALDIIGNGLIGHHEYTAQGAEIQAQKLNQEHIEDEQMQARNNAVVNLNQSISDNLTLTQSLDELNQLSKDTAFEGNVTQAVKDGSIKTLEDVQAWKDDINEELELSNKPLYSKATADTQNQESLTTAKVEQISNDFLEYHNGNIPLSLLIRNTQEEIYGDRATIEKEGIIKGAYHSKQRKITLAATNLQGKRDTVSTLRHEVLGHYGLNTFKPEDKKAILEKIIASKNHPSIKKTQARIDELYKNESELIRAEEVFAAIAEEKRGFVGSTFDQIASFINKALRAIGLTKSPLSKPEIRRLIASIGKGIKRGKRVQQTFPKSDNVQFRLENTSWRNQKGYEDVSQETFDALDKIGKPPEKNLKAKFKTAFQEHSYRWRNKLRQSVVDQYDSFKNILNDETAWMMSNLSNTGAAVSSGALTNGSPFLDKSGAVDIDTNKKSLAKIVQPLGNELDRWLQWIAGNRAEGLKVDGKENLFSNDDIKNLKGLANGQIDGQNRLALYNKVRVEFEDMHNAIVKIGVDTGLVSKQDADIWRKQGFYVPFYRIAEESTTKHGVQSVSGLVRQTAYKKLKGADMQLDDLLTNTLMNWTHIVGAGLKNQAATKALNSAITMGLAKEIPIKLKDNDSVFIRKNGKEKWYSLDKSQEGALVLNSLTALNYDGLNSSSMKVMRKFKRALTVGVTASPEFKIANLIRDTLQAVAVADMDTNIFKNLHQGFKATSKDNHTIARMEMGGGAFGDSGYIHGSDPDSIKILLGKEIQKNTILDSRRMFKKVFDMYQDLGARAENVNRAANFEQEMAKENSNLLKANFDARDHLDFARTGSFVAVRAMAQVVPFLNARLQGLDKLGRAGMDKNQRKQFATVVATYSLASVLLFLAMKDDDDYKQAEQWERDTYHLFKVGDTMFRIPRPFEVGVIGSMMERAAEQLVDDEVHGKLFAERLGHAVLETFAMNPVPQMFKPVMETWANKSWFTGRGIESQAMRRLSKTERKKAWTSQTAIGLSKAMDTILWDKVTLSPVQIEHLVQGYFGWAGATALGAIDQIARPALGVAERPDRNISEYPVIGRFVRRGENRNSRFITEFYETQHRIKQHYADIKNYRDNQEFDKEKAAMDKYKDDLKHRKRYSRDGKKISKINKKIRLITTDKNISGAVKRRRINNLNARRKKIARQAVEAFNK